MLRHWIALDRGKIRIHEHAFFADFARRSRHPIRADASLDFAFHAFHKILLEVTRVNVIR
ncbi:MAG: hypothetical protein WBY93_18945 [Candidatus Binatus sp.]